ncbi:protein STRUBBELIG-RECEPTOR FAMILY 8 isoform X2 [Zea mays]|uniref:Putative STRUBBELIG family receptor protein kinase n=1 Tax=Zea mays TaxID=4577 RepID=A0A1D6QRG5_MAIZE|nr:protein STRUBBELIG-RECEPTOR FAMILY 8 isoform X2 [Zea mays]AQK60097.1 Putative STRUBBELIG family receptor protein kinase [Zea mays]|eukprot:XP_023158013.1 protein STRUBBELIG-RECEPTOR FAMILY 8 isoform X2 [Zea mays]
MGAPRHLLDVAMLCALFVSAASFTDPPDALGLLGLYHTLESPWQLSGWTFQGGDPCGEGGGSKHWRGVFCKGPSIVAINISGLGVGGWLGPDLLKFQSLKKLDMSFNNIAGEIPSTLPPNVEYLNLAANKFEGNIPSSLPWLRSLKYLNFSYNKLSGVIGDVFVNMDSLETMDLSFNAFNSDLPRSFSSLTSLRYLYLQHNEFTGSVILLAGLPLSSLNIENNHFSGYVPGTFQSIPELRIDGNQFQPGFKLASSSFTRKTPAAPPQSLPPPPLQSPSPSPSPLAAQQKPKRRPKSPKPSFGYSSLQNNSHHRKSHSRVTAAAMASATCTVFVLLVVGLVLRSRKSCSCSPKSTSNHAKTLPANMETVPTANEVLYSWSSLLIGSDTSSSNGITSERVPKIKSWFKASKKLLTAKQFPAADILAATKDFNEECFIGEGLTGRVYRGEFSDGQLLAIKRIDMVDLSLSEQDELMDMLWNVSRLKHPNISALVGYCVEFEHCALLYEYAENGSLDDILFAPATRSMALSWKARMKIALGVAYALEYMHLTYSPPVAHGNIKARNILLDAQLMPYLCDCGLAKLSHFVSTTRMKDSEAIISAKGYAAPELSDPGANDIKADIYSFGVILLVLLTGQKAFDSSRRQSDQFLVDWAAPHLDDLDSLERITDPRISGSMPPKAISSLGIIILLCVKQSPDLRPPMTIITDKLVKLVESTGLQKISTTRHLEIDAQDPSFITTRPYFEPSSTVRVELRAASHGDECPFFLYSSGSYAALYSRWHSKYLEFSTVVAPLSAFLIMPIGDGQSCCDATL